MQGQAILSKLSNYDVILITVLLLQVEDWPDVPPVVVPLLKCHVMLQKEPPDGPPIDEECGDVVESGHAGLCR